jgi:parallel beta-helix repeat protein
MLIALLTPAGCSDREVPAAPDALTRGPQWAVVGSPTRVIHVPDDFATIQAAVDAAEPGDLIEVAAGAYSENVVITKSGLRLRAPVAQGAERAVLDGAGHVGIGVHVLGTAAAPVRSVEIQGFVVQDFERGIVLENVEQSRVHLNEVRAIIDKAAPIQLGDGIVLIATRASSVTQNFTHDNGHDGVLLLGSSSGNTIRGNEVQNNGAQRLATLGGCGIEFGAGTNDDNEIVENLVVGNAWGIRIGFAGTSIGNLVAQNRAHENQRAGIAVVGTSNAGNFIRQNNATGNGLANITPTFAFDLFDEGAVDNTWVRNQGRSSF